MLEIERKFKVKNTTFLTHSTKSFEIYQGYLSSDPERTVRIRTKNERAYITIKGIGNASGATRFEWEKEIPKQEALALLDLCENYSIQKTRYEVMFKEHLFEVDVFHAKNDGLIIAEIELQEENAIFEKPDWLGEEVTGQEKYYNAYLSTHPYSIW